ISSAFDMKKTRCVPTLMRDQQDVSHILETVAALFVGGAPVNLDRVFWQPDYCRVTLPLYPFRRDSHWLRDTLGLDAPNEVKSQVVRKVHPLLGRAVSIGSRRAVFESTLAAAQPWVDHRIMGSTVLPGTAYLEMAAHGFAASKDADWQSVILRDVVFERPIVLGYGKPKKVKLVLEARASNGGAGESTFLISAAGDSGTENHCQGRIVTGDGRLEQVSLEAELGRMNSKQPIGQFYGDFRNAGFEYGANFSTIRELWLGQPDSAEAIGRVTASASPDASEDHPFRYSAVLEGSFQVIRAAMMTLGETEIRGVFVPRFIKSAVMACELPYEVWSHVTVRP